MARSAKQADIIIFGAGIAGLWTFHALRAAGYNVLLLEKNGVGGIQSVGSQGILHSGLKYALAGKINELAASISAMPARWKDALRGQGPVDLSSAKLANPSQQLLIPRSLMGGMVNVITKKMLGDEVRELSTDEWSSALKQSGFKGHAVYMDEPVLDVPSVVKALYEPAQSAIRSFTTLEFKTENQNISSVIVDGHELTAQRYIFTAAGGNHEIAKQLGHDAGLKTQKRPLLMGMLRNAPCELYAHLVSMSEKPVLTITSHKSQDGELIWYLGGQAAEHKKETNPKIIYKAARKTITKYLPGLSLEGVQWASFPVDRVEGQAGTQGWLPDQPTIHECGNALYGWPTKLTFAPLLAERLLERVQSTPPSNTQGRFEFLQQPTLARPPWENTNWEEF